MSERWQEVWRRGIAPQLSDAGLEALAVALRDDSPELIQFATTSPPPISHLSAFTPDGACLIGYAAWKGCRLNTVGEVEKFFNRFCMVCDDLMNEVASVRWALNWFDETPRAEMRAALLPEVLAVLAARKAVTA